MNRSSWIQSASEDTPTPSSRIPPETSLSSSSPRAIRAITRGSSVGPATVERAGVRGEVVHPGLHRHGPAGQLRLAQPLGHPVRHPVDDRREQRPVGDVGVEGVLDADRLGLPVASTGRSSSATASRCRLVPCALPSRPHQLVGARAAAGRRRCGRRSCPAVARSRARRRGSPSPASAPGTRPRSRAAPPRRRRACPGRWRSSRSASTYRSDRRGEPTGSLADRRPSGPPRSRSRRRP